MVVFHVDTEAAEYVIGKRPARPIHALGNKNVVTGAQAS
jgi:hypothetical protein